jgi:Ca2+:H+ antiporter
MSNIAKTNGDRIFMLRKNHVKLVKQSLLGSIFVNLLFILGISMMSAGIKEATYDTRRTQILMFFTVTGILCLLIPTSLRACIPKLSLADAVTLKFSRGLSVALLMAYLMFVHFQIRSKSTSVPPPAPEDLEMSPYESSVEAASDSDATLQLVQPTTRNCSKTLPEEKEVRMHRIVSLTALLLSAGVVSVTAEFMVSSIEAVISDAPLTETFLGLIILPLLSNVAELVTSISVSSRGNIDLAINITVGSAIQIATFMAPFMVLLGWATNKKVELYFDVFQTGALCGTMVLVAIMLISGRSHYLLGMLLCLAYVVIGLGAFFQPNTKGRV